MNLIILGPQGSGKGTQAGLLARKYKLVHIEMGELLREIASRKTKLGRKINKIINKKKELVSDKIIGEIIAGKIKRIPGNKGVIFDGIPRKLSQTRLLGKVLERLSRKIDKVLFIELSEKESVKRISKRFHCEECGARLILGKDIKSPKSRCPVCGEKVIQRPDDTSTGVKKRLKIFREQTLPVVEYFSKNGLLVKADGEQPVEKVFRDILKNLKSLE